MVKKRGWDQSSGGEGSDSDVARRGRDASDDSEDEGARSRKSRRAGNSVKYREKSSDGSERESPPKRTKDVKSSSRKRSSTKTLKEESTEDSSEETPRRRKAKSKKPVSSSSEDEDEDKKSRKHAKRRKAGPASKVKKSASSDKEDDDPVVQLSSDEDAPKKKTKRRKVGPASKVKKPISSDEEDKVENGNYQSVKEQVLKDSSDEDEDKGSDNEEETNYRKKEKRKRVGPASKVKKPQSSDEDHDEQEDSNDQVKKGSSNDSDEEKEDVLRKKDKRKKVGPASKVKKSVSSEDEQFQNEKDESNNESDPGLNGERRKKSKQKKGGPASKVKKTASSDEEEQFQNEKDDSNNESDPGQNGERRKKSKQKKVGPASKVKKTASSDEEDENDEQPDQNSSDEEIKRKKKASESSGDVEEKSIENVSDNSAISDAAENSEDDVPVSRRKKKQSSSEDDAPLSRHRKKRNSSIDDDEKSEEEAPLSKRRGKSRTSAKGSKAKRDSPQKESSRSRRSGRERKVVKENLAEEAYGDDSEKQPTDPDSDFEENTNESSQEDDFIVEETTRRSGRERKKVEKFVVEVAEVKRKKKKVIDSSEENEEDHSASDAKESGSDNYSEPGSESEYEKKKKRQKKKKKVNTIHNHKKFKTRKIKERKKKSKNSDESDVTESSENEKWEKNFKAQQKQSKTTRKKINKKSPTKGVGATTGRERTKVNYAAEDESDSDDVRSDYDPVEDDVEVVEQEGIDIVLDHRKGKVGATGEATMYHQVKEHDDPNETLETTEMETQYLIKWKDWAHIFNTWETEETLEAMKKEDTEIKGLKKLENYQNSIREYEFWKKRASKEDIEYQEVDNEMIKNLRLTYLEIDRIFAKRKGEDQNEYYVKWKNLPYEIATWELEDLVKEHYPEALNCFKARKKLKKDPNDYKEGMKGFNKTFRPMKEQPDFIGDETFRLRDYQLDGVNFMLRAWYKNNSVIMADEMGLGKTIQTIAFLKYLWHNFNFNGPMLVIVPLSTITAWQTEFAQWAPDMNTITYIGNQPSREVIREYECQNEDDDLCFNVVLTSYEMVSKDAEFFQGIVWSNIVVDEAHRLKNENSLLYRILSGMESYHRLLLTGTPLQNSLKELWCLLNYLQVDEVGNWEEFEQSYGTEEDKEKGYVKLHTLLKPYIIRRMKKDVEKSLPGKVEQILRVDMTVRQKKLYKLVLTKNYNSLQKGKNQVSLLNIMMQLRKTCNHADLIQQMESKANETPEERLKQVMYGSGKMLLLDKLLTRFKEEGSKVLIFSQMVIMLSILEEYLALKRYSYQILTGSVSCDKRKQSIAQFNAEGSTDFCFLLSTRAGGLGINLQSANRVIIFDSDFNPQNDLQAIARAHRIGQKQEVKIFRFVSSSSVDEDIIHKAKNKMVLDHLVIQNMDTTGKAVIGKKTEKQFDKNELNAIIKFGAADLFNNDGEDEEKEKDVDLDAILEKAELREEEDAPISDANRELLSAFKVSQVNFEETEENIDGNNKDWDDIIPKDQRPEEEKEKKIVEGLELLSDTEDLYQPISQRRKTRNKKVKTPKKNEKVKKKKENSEGEDDDKDDKEDDDKGSDYAKDSDESDSSAESNDDDDEPGDAKVTVVKPNAPIRVSQVKPLIPLFRCLDCARTFNQKASLTAHMKQKHPETPYKFTPENYTNLPAVKSTHNYCMVCGNPYPAILMYQVHVAQVHNGIEPPDNFDEEKIEAMKESNREKIRQISFQREQAKQAKIMAEMHKNLQQVRPLQFQQNPPGQMQRKTCLICMKVFADGRYLKQHMTNSHKVLNFVQTEANNYIQPTKQPLVNSGNYPPSSQMPPILDKKNYVCIEGDCKKQFVEKRGLKLHMKTIHNMLEFSLKPENRLPISLNKPGVTITPVSSLQEARPHLPKNCLPCGKSFPHHVLYQIHMRDFHTNKTSSPPKTTSIPAIIEITKDEKLDCLICHKRLAGKRQLKRHIKFIHMQIGKHAEDTSSNVNGDSKKEVSDSSENKNKTPTKSETTISEKSDEIDKNRVEGSNEEKTETDEEKLEGVSKDGTDKEKLEETDKEKLAEKEKEKLKGTDKEKLEDNDKEKEEETDKEKSEETDKEKSDETDKEKSDETDKERSEEKDTENVNTDETPDEDPLSDPLALDNSKTSENSDEIEIIGVKKIDEVTLSDDDDDSVDNMKGNISDEDKRLIEKMFMMMRKYGCIHCPQRYDSQVALKHHLRIHKKKVSPGSSPIGIVKPYGEHTFKNVTITKVTSPKKVPKPSPSKSIGVDGATKSPGPAFPSHGTVKVHDNEDGPVCYKCQQVCKDASNLKNHILSHYYSAFDGVMPKTKPFSCPVCEKPSRDKITAIRHFAFTHNKLVELTDVTPENLQPGRINKKRAPPKSRVSLTKCDDDSNNGDNVSKNGDEDSKKGDDESECPDISLLLTPDVTIEESDKPVDGSTVNSNAVSVNTSDQEDDQQSDQESKESNCELSKKRKRESEELDDIPDPKRGKGASSRESEIGSDDSCSNSVTEKMDINNSENEGSITKDSISEEKEESHDEITSLDKDLEKEDLKEKVQEEASVQSMKELQANKENDEHFEVSS